MRLSAKLAAVALALAVIGIAAPAHAACCEPQPPVAHCDFTFKSLKAVNLWDDGDSDFVIFQAKGNNFPGGGSSIKFFLGTQHGAAAFNYPTATANLIVRSFGLKVIIDEPWPLANVEVLPTWQPLCGSTLSGTNLTVTFSNGDANYELTFDQSPPHF